MTAEERERAVEDVEEFTADVLVLASDLNAHLTLWNDWPVDQYDALLDKVRRFGWYLESLAPTEAQREEIAADDKVTEMRECRS